MAQSFLPQQQGLSIEKEVQPDKMATNLEISILTSTFRSSIDP